jgi:hypothetical protein
MLLMLGDCASDHVMCVREELPSSDFMLSHVLRGLRSAFQESEQGLRQRFGHENRGAGPFLQHVTPKPRRLIHSHGVMIIVHHLKR